MAGAVVSIYIAESGGQAMEARNEAELVAGLGIPGDRYHSGRGEFSPTTMDPDHELTLISIKEVETFNFKTGHWMAPRSERCGERIGARTRHHACPRVSNGTFNSLSAAGDDAQANSTMARWACSIAAWIMAFAAASQFAMAMRPKRLRPRTWW